MTYPADTDPDSALAPLQSAACTYRLALGPGRAKGAGGVVVMAKQLRVSKPTLYRRLKRYNISADNAGGPSFSVKSAVFSPRENKIVVFS